MGVAWLLRSWQDFLARPGNGEQIARIPVSFLGGASRWAVPRPGSSWKPDSSGALEGGGVLPWCAGAKFNRRAGNRRPGRYAR